MCSRYARWIIDVEIEEFSDIRLPPRALPVNYNAAPQSSQPIVRMGTDTGELEVVMARWGLIPYWAKDSKVGYSTINARSEELRDKPAFRESLKSRRCLIPANCFYEWQKWSARERLPFAIAMRDDRPFMFAGLWDRWRSPEGILVESFTIATTSPNELMQPLHDRMPCIVEPSEYRRWLDVGVAEKPPLDILRPFPAEKMRLWRVDKAVGNVKNDDSTLVTELVANESYVTPSLWD